MKDMCGINYIALSGLGFEDFRYRPAARDVSILCPFRAVKIIHLLIIKTTLKGYNILIMGVAHRKET